MMIRPVHQFSDKGLDTANTKALELSILLSQDGFSFTVFDPSRNKFVAIESHEYTGIPSGTPEEKAAAPFKSLAAYAVRHTYLSKPFAKTTLLIENRESTLVPDPVYDSGNLEQYLRFANDIPAASAYRADHITSIGAMNVFAFPASWEQKFRYTFTGVNIGHSSTYFIDCLLTKHKNVELRDRIFIHIRPSWFEIAYFAENSLILYNTFIYRTKEDFIYFILFVFEQLNINPEIIQVILMGEIEKNSPLHEMLVKYIRNVEFGFRFEDFEYSYIFDEIPQHYYFTLLNSRICAL